MNTKTALRHAARLEYSLIRLPLNLVDDRLVRRYLDDSSPVRQSFERALGALDDAVEKLLREPGAADSDDDEPDTAPPETAQPETAQPETAQPETAQPETAQPETAQPETAKPRTARARAAKPKTAQSKAPADAPAPQVVEDETEQIEHLTEELLEEEETETFVGELAEDDELRQVQAELQAKRLIEEQQEGR